MAVSPHIWELTKYVKLITDLNGRMAMLLKLIMPQETACSYSGAGGTKQRVF